MDGMDGSTSTQSAKRSASPLLAIAIFVMPILFVWFLLRRGYSNMARLAGFGWLGVFFIVGLLAPESKNASASNEVQPAETAQIAGGETKEAPEPVNPVDQLDEAIVVSKCDLAVQSTLTNKGSFDTAWSWKFLKHPEKGRVTVLREFEAENAFGGTISSEYKCLVDARSSDLVELAIRQGGNWDIIYKQ